MDFREEMMGFQRENAIERSTAVHFNMVSLGPLTLRRGSSSLLKVGECRVQEILNGVGGRVCGSAKVRCANSE